MRSFLLCHLFLLSWAGTALAQTKPDTTVRCAPDSVVRQLRGLMEGLQFNHDSSYVEFVPDSGFSDLGSKARIITDQPTCSRAHEVFLREAVESESDPNQVAVARVGSFYFIYEYGGSELAVVDRNWRQVAVIGWGL